jgi:hypothetical protein
MDKIEIPEVDGLDTVFGNIKHLPAMKDIPEEFKTGYRSNKWIAAQMDWFFKGIKPTSLIPKEGVDRGKAIRALQAIQCSFEPSHEHKEAGVAYLMSLWFDDYVPEVKS